MSMQYSAGLFVHSFARLFVCQCLMTFVQLPYNSVYWNLGYIKTMLVRLSICLFVKFLSILVLDKDRLEPGVLG